MNGDICIIDKMFELKRKYYLLPDFDDFIEEMKIE